MGRKSIMAGVRPKGLRRIQFDFEIDGVRFRPTLPWVPTPANLEQAQKLNARIKAQIEAGTFVFSDVFLKFRGLRKLPGRVCAKSCGEVFDAFLRHEEARVVRDDLAPITLKSHRQILDCVWRPALGQLPFLAVQYSMMVKVADSHRWNKKTYNNAISALRRAFAFGYLDYPDRIDPATRLRSAKMGKNDRPRIDPFSTRDAEVFIAALHQDWGEAHGNYEEFRFFTGLRPSEEIAFTVSGYDRVNRVLSVTKARVDGIDKDCTKTGEDRRIQLCPRAVAILERQLQVRTRLMEQHGIQNEPHLFVTDEGGPIPDVTYPYGRWERTLKRLRIRYRRPYVARHTSVSWNLMMGRNPLLIAKEHGHRILTMLTVYAAWTEGAVEADFWAIHDAMYRTDLDTLRSRSVASFTKVGTSPDAMAETPAPARCNASSDSSVAAGAADGEFGTEYGTQEVADLLKCLTALRNLGGADGTQTRPPA
ncbi:MAG: phage integrase family protein [Gammaproteobacteria bacterium]|nr:phage integrase family protein [Gammaproteobacteria bacterium]